MFLLKRNLRRMLDRLPDLLPGSCVNKIFPPFIGTKLQVTAHGHIENVHNSGFDICQCIEINDSHIIRIIYIFLGIRIPESHPAITRTALLPEHPFQL